MYVVFLYRILIEKIFKNRKENNNITKNNRIANLNYSVLQDALKHFKIKSLRENK